MSEPSFVYDPHDMFSCIPYSFTDAQEFLLEHQGFRSFVQVFAAKAGHIDISYDNLVMTALSETASSSLQLYLALLANYYFVP